MSCVDLNLAAPSQQWFRSVPPTAAGGDGLQRRLRSKARKLSDQLWFKQEPYLGKPGWPVTGCAQVSFSPVQGHRPWHLLM